MFRLQPDLFLQLAEHGLFGRFALLDAPLRELPGMLADALAPEDFVVLIDQNNADVRAITFPVEHDATFKCLTNCNSFIDGTAWKGRRQL